jgi:hypothetical protein
MAEQGGGDSLSNCRQPREGNSPSTNSTATNHQRPTAEIGIVSPRLKVRNSNRRLPPKTNRFRTKPHKIGRIHDAMNGIHHAMHDIDHAETERLMSPFPGLQ